MPPLSICVINFNGEECLLPTLAPLSRLTVDVAEVIVIDSASTDRSVDIVRDRHPDFRLIRLPDNQGPGRARNVGLRASTSDLVLFIDYDVVVAPDTPEHLVRALRSDHEATFAMPRVLCADDPDTVQYDGAGSHFVGLMKLENANRPVDGCAQNIRSIQSLITACFLIDRARWGSETLFDERLFIYLEDHDLGLRARIMGCRILSVPAPCYHGRGTIGLSLRRVGDYADLRIDNLIRNRWVLLLKNYRARTLLVLAPFLFVFECFQLAGAIKKGWLSHWLSACASIIRDRNDIRRDRRAVQSSRETRDRDVLTGGAIPFSDELLRGPVEKLAGQLLDGGSQVYWLLARRLI